jgi:t-SNARE complex subunit (syntaxin)
MMKNKKEEEEDIVERAEHGINMMVAERVTKTIRNGGVVLVILIVVLVLVGSVVAAKNRGYQ